MSSFTTYLQCLEGDSINNVFQKPISLENYMVGVVDISGQLTRKKTKKNSNSDSQVPEYFDPLYLCCDIISDSYIGNISLDPITLPVLRKIYKTSSTNVNIVIPKILFVCVTSTPVSCIRLYIANGRGEPAALSNCKLNVTLLFYKYSS